MIRLLSGIPLCGVQVTPREKIPVRLTVVGDDDQGIYEFRGAMPGVISRLQASLDAMQIGKVHALTINYRSTQSIIDECQALMWPYSDAVHKQHLPPRGKHGSIFTAAASNAESLSIFSNHTSRCTALNVIIQNLSHLKDEMMSLC